jgi:hypothetical protein
MADEKISQLPLASTITGAVFPGAQGNTTKGFPASLFGSGGGGSGGAAVGGATPLSNHPTGTAGVANAASREDHRHPSDTTRLTEEQVRALVPALSAEPVGRPIASADLGRELLYTGTSPGIFPLPAVGLPPGSTIILTQDATGKASFSAGSGATVENRRNTGQLSTAGFGATIVATFRGQSLWVVNGDTGA